MTAALTRESLVEAIDKALPQTQCTRCGYVDCRAYAQAVAAGEAQINQCPPGGQDGVRRLAALTGRPSLPLNPSHGSEGPRQLAIIDEAWCIGCTLCIKACPVDCIVGAAKKMHVVVNAQRTGCELCIPACPVDCISLQPVTVGLTGWQAWSAEQAAQVQDRYEFRQLRVERAKTDNTERLLAKAEAKLADVAAASRLTEPEALETKRAVIQAAIARAKAQRR